VPDNCNFTVDIRTTDKYTNREILNIIKKNVACEVIPRSIKLNSSALNRNHLMVLCGLELGLSYYGSPTTSDQALMFFPTFKMGPGDSVRSHTADEFIYLKEIEEGIKIYIKLLNKFNLL
jgi:acetylornithine deacetylase